MSKHIKSILLLAIILVGLSTPKLAFANLPYFSGHVYYVNQDGAKTTQGVTNIYVEWIDASSHTRYTKTDNNGEFNFEQINEGSNVEDRIRKAHRTWIKPDQPEVAPLYDSANPDKDYRSQSYSRLYSEDLYQTAFTCSNNPHKFHVVQPKTWTGEFMEAETNWSNDDGNALTHSKVIDSSTIGEVNFNNSIEFGSVKQFIANFYYKPVLISGQVISSKDNQPVPGVKVNVYNTTNNPRSFITDSTGRFQVAEFIGKGETYAVRIENTPEGYKIPAKTTTLGWTKRQGAPATDPNTPLNSPSYEMQKYGEDDCAGPALSGPDAGKVGRCNFKLDPKPIASTAASSSPSTAGQPTDGQPTASGSPAASAGSGGTTPIGSFPPGASGEPTAQCINLPIGESVASVLIDDRPLTLTNAGTFSLTLKGFAGQSNFIIPVVINYSNNACRIYNLGFKYVPPPTSRPSPKPEDCAKSTGRPDDCACTADSQCQGGKCDPNRGSVCSTLPFIQTQGGDVHSNIKIEQ